MLDNRSIGRTIREIRRKKGLTQEQLAEKMYVQKQAVSNWERGKSNLSDESKRMLKNVLGLDLFEMMSKEGNETMNIKPLNEIDNLSELEGAVTTLLDGITLDAAYSETVKSLLEITMNIVLGFECYYMENVRRKDREQEDILDWSYVAWDVANLIDDAEKYPIPDKCTYPFNKDFSQLKKKLEWMGYMVGGDLFEDFAEDGYHNGFVQQIGRLAEGGAHDITNILPNDDNAIVTSYKMAIYRLAEKIENITS